MGSPTIHRKRGHILLLLLTMVLGSWSLPGSYGGPTPGPTHTNHMSGRIHLEEDILTSSSEDSDVISEEIDSHGSFEDDLMSLVDQVKRYQEEGNFTVGEDLLLKYIQQNRIDQEMEVNNLEEKIDFIMNQMSKLETDMEESKSDILHLIARAPPGVDPLTMDSTNYYYRVSIPHGVSLREGSVPEACARVGMEPVCYSRSTSDSNCNDCLYIAGGEEDESVRALSVFLCGDRNPGTCPPLYGLFVARKGWLRSECGVLEDNYCTTGRYHTSGPGYVYRFEAKHAAYYGLCALAK